MPPRRGLGRGLDALIPVAPLTTDLGDPTTGPFEVAIDAIDANPRQPRQLFDEGALADLAESIRLHGVLQPLVVTRHHATSDGAPRYQLIAGERRLQASRLAGRTHVPIILRDASPRDWLELALVENLQRADLNPLEAAVAYRQLTTDFALTHEEIGRRVGRNRHTIANTLRLLNLPPSVQQDLRDGDLTEGHARALLGLADGQQQRALATRVIDEGLSVRQTEALVRRFVAPPENTVPRVPEPHPFADRISDALGRDASRVDLVRTRRGGRVVIHFRDDAQLGRIYARLATPIGDVNPTSH